MSDKEKKDGIEIKPEENEPGELRSRRDFLRSLGRWSGIIIGGAALGGIVGPTDAAGWVNGGGAAWVNGRGGGAGWVNRAVGGGTWVNRTGGWVNAAGWVNRAGGAWVNTRGGWINRY